MLAVYALAGVVLCDRLGVIDMPAACEGRWLTPNLLEPIMSLTLPGDAPGLLQLGAPVRDAADPQRIGVVIGTGSNLGIRVLWCWSESREWRDPASLLLDLSEPTGRLIAAAWLQREPQP